jgi:hypothetical protein
MLGDILEDLRPEIDRSTLQAILVADASKRYSIPPELVEEALKILLAEFLIGLLGLDVFHDLGQRLRESASAYLAAWSAGRAAPAPPPKPELDEALEAAVQAARAHARTEAELQAATERVRALMRQAGASPSETRDVVETLTRVLGKSWTK